MKLPLNKLVVIVAGLAGMLLIAILLLVGTTHNKSRYVTVGGTKITVEIAGNNAERERGLCCRKSLAQDHGMLFIYDESGDYRYWMKDTLIPLDIIWIDSNKKIIHIERSVQPSSYPKSFGAGTPAQYVLEVNAGYTKNHGINVGDTASF